MTEEMIKETKKEECNCFCKSEGFRNFIVVATGTFVGVFCAISLFAALHKPPKMIPMNPHFAQPYVIQHVQGCPIQEMHKFHHGMKPHHKFDGPRHHHHDFGEHRPHPKFDGKKFDKEKMEKFKKQRALEKKMEN